MRSFISYLSGVQQQREAEIIQFIKDHYQNENALLDFFNQLDRPLSQGILSVKVMTRGKCLFNFLAYASCYPYFDYILSLTPAKTLHDTFDKMPWFEKLATLKGILQASKTNFLKVYPLFSKEEFLQVLVSPNQVLSENALIYIIPKMDTEIIDYIIGMANYDTPGIVINIVEKFKSHPSLRASLCVLLAKTSIKKRTKLIQARTWNLSILLGTSMQQINFENLIEALFSGVDGDLVGQMCQNDNITPNWKICMLNAFTLISLAEPDLSITQVPENENGLPQRVSLNIAALIPFMSSKTLMEIIHNPLAHLPSDIKEVFNLEAANTPQILEGRFFILMGQSYPILFNAIVKQLFNLGSHPYLEDMCVYRLDIDNLALFMAEHPQYTFEDMQKIIAFTPDFPLDPKLNDRYQPSYLARLNEAVKRFHQILSTPTHVYRHLQTLPGIYFAAQTILEYSIDHPLIRERMIYEITHNTPAFQTNCYLPQFNNSIASPSPLPLTEAPQASPNIAKHA